MSTPVDPPVDPAAPADPAATVTVADEVATVLGELIDGAEKFTTAGVQVPFSAARILLDKLRAAGDALELQLRKATGH